MPDTKLRTDWIKQSNDFVKSVGAAGFPPVLLKVLKTECGSISDALETIYDAQNRKKLVEAMKGVKSLDSLLGKVETSIGKGTKNGSKELLKIAEAIDPILKKLLQAQKEMFKEILVKQSQEQAFAEGKVDWKAALSDDMIAKFAKVTLDTSEYGKFSSAFGKFVSEYDLSGVSKQLPVVIWAELIKGLAKSGYIEGKIKHVEGDPKQFILAEMRGPGGKLIRDNLLSQSMEGLTPFLNHAKKYLDAVVKKRGQGSKWAFWSGIGAKEAAKAEAGGGIVLEGTIGSWFDEVWDFEKLTGGTKSLALWAAMSELYAKKAAEHYGSFEFVGFLGPGSMRDQSVFNKIEQPTFIEIFDTKIKKPAPDITWWVTDCEQEDGRWVWTKKKSVKIGTDRNAALKQIKARYGG